MIKKLFIGSTNIDFLQVGKLFYRIFVVESIIFVSVGVLSLVGVLNVNLSVDFSGGTTYQLEAPYTTNNIDEVINNSDREDNILIYCYKGISSQNVAQHFCNLGYKNIFSLEGGFTEFSEKSV